MTHVPQQRWSTLARVHDSSQSVVLPTEQCGLFSSNLTQERRLQHTQGLSTQFTKGQPSQGFSTPLTQASSPQLNGPTFANTDYAYSARGHMHTSLVPHKQQAHTNFNLDMSQATAYQASYSADWVTHTTMHTSYMSYMRRIHTFNMPHMPLTSFPMTREKILNLIQEHARNKVNRLKSFTNFCTTPPFVPRPRFKYLKISSYIGDFDPSDWLNILWGCLAPMSASRGWSSISFSMH